MMMSVGQGPAVPVAAAEVPARLAELGATVAIAESLTGGLLCAALTDTPGASATVRHGLVVHASDLMASLAGVSQQLLAERGAAEIRAPAVQARLDLLGSEYGRRG